MAGGSMLGHLAQAPYIHLLKWHILLKGHKNRADKYASK